MLDYINSKDKKPEKKEPPQWFQESDFGQSVMQQRDKAVQWVGDTFGIQPPDKSQNPGQQQSSQLKNQMQAEFLQTPMGQTVNGWFSDVMQPLDSSTEQKRQQYETELNTIYSDHMKKMGTKVKGLVQ